jgi:hypothetical protein
MKSLASFLTHALHKWNVLIFTITAVLGMAMCCSNAIAQSGAGSIQGTITDATGAVIPEASVHVVNQATGVAVDTKSNNVGFYQVPSLFTGTYVVTIGAPGMKTYVQTIELLVDQTAAINAVMTAGAVTEQVQVNADIVQLTSTENGVTGATLENARINQLPMNGRNLLTLSNDVTPGLDKCNQSPSCANGLMPAATAYVVDGVTLESREFGGANAGQNALPDPDSVQEVSVQTSGVGAAYEDAYQKHLLDQARRQLRSFPYSDGFCIDRLDWLRFYNQNGDDHVGWFDGRATESLVISWHQLMSKLGPEIHAAGKVLFCNNHTKRIDLLCGIDGIYDEFA